MANRFINKLLGFAKLTEGDVAALERATGNPRAYGARTDLIREGDRPGPMLVMLDGWAFRYKILPNGTRQIMAFLMPGDACDLHVGLLAEMDHGIQTVKRADVATISRATIDDLTASRPAVARAMYIAQLVDQGTMRAWIVGLGRRTSLERVAHLLLELFIRAASINATQAGVMDLPMSQLILADAVGITPVHINRVLQSLRRSGALELGEGMLRIQNTAALVDLSGFDDSYLHKRLRDVRSVTVDR